MSKFLEINEESNPKIIHRIPIDNIGDIVSEENNSKGIYKITIYDRMKNEVFTRSYGDYYSFDDTVKKINAQIRGEN